MPFGEESLVATVIVFRHHFFDLRLFCVDSSQLRVEFNSLGGSSIILGEYCLALVLLKFDSGN
jgi:hypothetical protein